MIHTKCGSGSTRSASGQSPHGRWSEGNSCTQFDCVSRPRADDAAVDGAGGGLSPVREAGSLPRSGFHLARSAFPLAQSASHWSRSAFPRVPRGELFPPLSFCPCGRATAMCSPVETHQLAPLANNCRWPTLTGRPLELRKEPVAAVRNGASEREPAAHDAQRRLD